MTQRAWQETAKPEAALNSVSNEREYIMDNIKFKLWRKKMGFTQSAAAEALGVSRATIQLYELGYRTENPKIKVAIPKSIALACAAINANLNSFGE